MSEADGAGGGQYVSKHTKARKSALAIRRQRE
jgi:hypothetical protein